MSIQKAYLAVIARIRSVVALVLDMMEYSTDSAAQTAYVTSATAYTAQYPSAHSDTYVKATTEVSNSEHHPYYATDPSLSLTGSGSLNTWQTDEDNGNQRFHIDLGSSKIINQIYYENFHTNGLATERGSNNFTFWGSDNAAAFAELTYGTDTNWTQITGLSQSTFDEHTASNVADPKYITITGNTTAYRYYALKIVDNHGDASLIGLRHIELQTADLISLSEPTIKTQGSYALKLSATTDALNETVTKTLTGGDILDLTGKNTIKFDARATATGGNLEFSIRDSGNENSGNLFIEADTDISDKNGTHTITAVNGAALDTSTYSPNNNSSSSIKFVKSESRRLTVPDSADWDLFTSAATDATIDFWVKQPASGVDAYEYISQWQTVDERWRLMFDAATGGLRFNLVVAGSYDVDTGIAGDITDTNWHHVALVKEANLYTIYLDGTSVCTDTSSATNSITGPLTIGFDGNADNHLDGNMDNIRITKGTALWTANFNLTDAELFYAKRQTHTITIASADTYQEEVIDISGVADADKSAIDQLQLKVLGAGSAIDHFVDNIRAE